MSRIISILLIGVGGYYLIQKRYRLLNLLLGNFMLRRLAINLFMNIPGMKNKMMGSMFSPSPDPNY